MSIEKRGEGTGRGWVAWIAMLRLFPGILLLFLIGVPWDPLNLGEGR